MERKYLKKRVMTVLLTLISVFALSTAAAFADTSWDSLTDTQKNSSYGFFVWLSENGSTDEIKQDALYAAQLLDGTATDTSLFNDGSISASSTLDVTYEDAVGYTSIGADKDATSWDCFKKAVEYIATGNEYRAKEDLAALKVSSAMMAMSELNTNSMIGKSTLGHTSLFNALENAAYKGNGSSVSGGSLTYYDPYEGWYTEEKTNYDENNGGQTGHYKTLTDRQGTMTITGFGFGWTEEYESPWYWKYQYFSQHFSNSSHYSATTGIDTDTYNSLITEYTCEVNGHTWDDGEVKSKASFTSDGTKVYTCSVCGSTKEEAIAAIDSITVDDSEITYTGSAIEPAVTVTDSNGSKLTEGSDYSVSYSNNTSAGNATVTVTGTGDYTGSSGAEFTIAKRALTISANDAAKTYGESDPKFGASAGSDLPDGHTLADCSITRSEGEDVGTYGITPADAVIQDASGNDVTKNYEIAYAAGDFKINKAQLTVTAADAEKTYGADDPDFTAKATGLVNDDELGTYTAARTKGDNAGTYSITVTDASVVSGSADATGNYNIKYAEGTFTINRKDFMVSPADASKVYGAEDPEFTVSTPDGLVNGDSVKTCNITRESGDNAGTYALTVSDAVIMDTEGNDVSGNYNITNGSGTFTINKADASVTLDAQSGSTSYPDAITVNVETTNTDGCSISATSSDTGIATVSVDGAKITVTPVKTGSVTVTVTASETNNFNKATATYAVTVAEGNMTVIVPENETVVYSGAEQSSGGVSVSVPDSGATVRYGESAGSCTSDSPAAYTNAGTYTVYYQVTADNYETVTGSYSFEITRKTVAEPSAAEGLSYTGSELTGVGSGDGYTVSGGAATNVGDYTAVATLDDTENYSWADGTTGSKEISWSIAKGDIASLSVTGLETQVYNGSEFTPEVTVTDAAGNTLANGSDYTVTYENNIEAGTASVVITATDSGNYTGSVTKYFEIEGKPLEESNVTVADATYTYDGSAKTPEVSVADEAGDTLAADTDYTVTYSNNVKAGTATVKVNGKGNYSGTISKSFKINAQSLKSANVKLAASSYTWNGKAKTPGVTVKNAASKTLKKNTDYTITYASGRKNVGKYTVKIVGKGNYKGTISKTFTIKPAKAAVSKITVGKKKMTVKASKKPAKYGASTFQIRYRIKGKSSWKTVTTTGQSKTISKLTKKKAYQVQIRAYKKVSGTTYYGAWSSVKTSGKIK